ncbi:hypothetical protein CYMTET_20010, partial [Cymbomonas tetramitiformis]
MDHARSDVISWIWSNPPDEGSGLTLEFWVYLYDLHLDHTPFSYGAYDSYTNYENANEFTVYLTSRFLRVFRGTSRYDCEAQRCLNISSVSEWNHIAATLDTSTGDLKIYIGGDLVDQTVVSGDFRKPIVPKGAVILGNEQDAFAGGFDELQALDGMLDNLRLWNCVRTASEIAKGLHQRLDPADYPDMTQLLHFDEVISESQGQIIQDLSGRGESALWGRMPTLKNEMIYQTARGITPPQAPRLVASLADVYGSAIVVYLHPGEARTILLRAHAEEESDIVVTLETELAATVGGSEGTLTNLDGHAIEAGATLSHSGDEGGPIVRYTAPQSLAGPVAWSANFSYRVTDVTSGEHTVATVVIHDLSQQTVSDMEFYTDEDTPNYLILGTIGMDGLPVQTILTSIPSLGTLHQASFQSDSPAKYTSVDYANLKEPLLKEDLPIRVSNSRGILIYEPPQDTANADFPLTSF